MDGIGFHSLIMSIENKNYIYIKGVEKCMPKPKLIDIQIHIQYVKKNHPLNLNHEFSPAMMYNHREAGPAEVWLDKP